MTMLSQTPQTYTPEQIATMLQLSKNTVYELINRGEILAKKFGKVYRISQSSVSYIFTGLDHDLYQAEQKDLTNIDQIELLLSQVRSKL